jgi:pteridine reductase
MPQPRPLALVTGAARRVGRCIAQALADAGYDVAFTFNTGAGPAQELVDQLQTQDKTALAIEADLTNPAAAVAQIQKSIMNRFGRLDALVNNASIYEPGDSFSKMWPIHVDSPLLLCRAFEKPLRAARGHVVNMLDLQAERPHPSYAAYCASKAALWNLTLSLARDLAPDVTVNGIAPGVVEWPDDYPQIEREKYLRRVPLGRAGTLQDVANAVVFFCTRADYVTGQILRLDGGRSLT